jgi:hypothetical protein
LANKPVKQPSKTTEHLRSIAIAIGFIGFGVTVTYIIMSQTTPLREALKDAKKQCSVLEKTNEIMAKQIIDLKNDINHKNKEINNYLGKLKEHETLIQENSNLKNIITDKDKEINNIKKQSEMDNKKMQETLTQKLKEIDRLNRLLSKSKKEAPDIQVITGKVDNELSDKIPANEETAEHLNTFGRNMEIPPEPYRTFDVWYVPINESKSYFSGEININLISIDKNNRISAKISSPGYPDTPINNGFVGQSLIYSSQKNNYNIHIAKVYNNKNYSWVKFTVKKIK